MSSCGRETSTPSEAAVSTILDVFVAEEAQSSLGSVQSASSPDTAQ